MLTACFLAAGILFVPRQLSAGGIVWHELWQLKGPFEGVDEKGHALVIEKLAEFEKRGRPGRPLAIYAYFRSDSANRSPMAGYGWNVPFFESRIVQTSETVFWVFQPDGFRRAFVRDKKDTSLLLSKRPWGGKIRGDVITVRCSCRNYGADHVHPELVFRRGQLVKMTIPDGEFTFLYDGNVVNRVQRNGQDFLRTVVDKKKGAVTGFEWSGGNRVSFELAQRPEVRVVKGKPVTCGNVLSLGRLMLTDGTERTFRYEVRGTNEFLRLPEKEIGWSAASKLIVRDGGWQYSVMSAKTEGDTATIGRVNGKGQKAFWHDDRAKGVLTVEGGDGIRKIETRFTSGRLRGLLRKTEEVTDGKRVTTGEYFYNEKGQMFRFKNAKDDMFFVYGANGTQAALVNNGKLLSVYTAEGEALAHTYLR